MERFSRLDVYKIQKGWQVLQLENPYTYRSYGCGVIPLSECEFLVVGGYTERIRQDRAAIFKTNLTDFT
jgi:hypothetical protein